MIGRKLIFFQVPISVKSHMPKERVLEPFFFCLVLEWVKHKHHFSRIISITKSKHWTWNCVFVVCWNFWHYIRTTLISRPSFTPSNARTQLSFLPAPVPRGGRCRHGEREVHCWDGRLCQSLGVQQHRGHDSPQWAVPSTNSLHQQTHPHRSQRMRGRHPSGQREGWGHTFLEPFLTLSSFCLSFLSKTNKFLATAVFWIL